MSGNKIIRLDRATREICRCFAEDDRIGVIDQLANLRNRAEAGAVAVMATRYMAPGTHQEFLTFMLERALAKRTRKKKR